MFFSGDVKGALSQIQRHLTAERAILEVKDREGRSVCIAQVAVMLAFYDLIG